MRKKTTKYIVLKILILIGLSVLVSSAVFSASTIPAISKTITLATTQQPENFTELYFENHTSLPKKVIPNQKYLFKFTIHNLENKKMTYSYEIFRTTENQRTDIQKGSITLSYEEFKTVPVTFITPPTMKRSKVVVRLTNKNQEINFWIEE